MKPALAHLSCLDYTVVALSVLANPDMEPTKATELTFDDLDIQSETMPDEAGKVWTVGLRIRQELPPERNVPYNFMLGMRGRFEVVEGYKNDPEWLVRTNAPSMLYSAAREILRMVMAMGPYEPILLPAVSFYQSTAPAEASAIADVAVAPKKRGRARKKSG